ncbi:MAG: FAD:protein FMN transferase [Candidatus Gracilibacteria bacterium]
MFRTHSFKAFDTTVVLGFSADESEAQKLIHYCEKEAEKFEAKFSRFIPTSEVSQLNTAMGAELEVSDEMIELVTQAKKAYELSKGLFDPTILNALKLIGYNKSFSVEPDDSSDGEQDFNERPRLESLKIGKNTLQAPEGFCLDLGGIAKGYWVDKMAKVLAKSHQNFWISAGGDMYMKGKQEDGNLWEIGVQNPRSLEEDLLRLKIREEGQGIATSGIAKRQGIRNGIPWHHLIDPRTGLPTQNSILAVTVLANSTMQADVMAKVVLVLGVEKGMEYLAADPSIKGLIIDQNLNIHSTLGAVHSTKIHHL